MTCDFGGRASLSPEKWMLWGFHTEKLRCACKDGVYVQPFCRLKR